MGKVIQLSEARVDMQRRAAKTSYVLTMPVFNLDPYGVGNAARQVALFWGNFLGSFMGLRVLPVEK